VVTYKAFVSTPGFEPSLQLRERELPFREEREGFSLTLKRNCSTTPAALASVFAALALVVLAIAAGFAAVGAWLVLPFAGLEVLLLAAAFVLYARRAADYERFELREGVLTVEVVEAQYRRKTTMDVRGARVRLERDRAWLRGVGEEELEIGRHLDPQTRTRFAAELARRLQR
jgi:uncharacterized membrane protein